MALLAVFQPDVHASARLRDALGEHHELLFGSSWPELWQLVLERPVVGGVVDPYNAFDSVGLPELHHFKRRFPAVALVVYADFAGREMDLYHLGRMGADGVIPAGQDETLRWLSSRVDLALSSCLAKRIADALETVLPRLGVRSIQWAVEQAESGPRVDDLATAMRLSPRSLARELRGMGLASPRQVLLWGRLFQAARYLEESDTTVEEVAFRLGYSTGASLGRAFRDRTGVAPSRFIEGDRGLEDVLAALVRSITGDDDARSDGRRWVSADRQKEILRSFTRP